MTLDDFRPQPGKEFDFHPKFTGSPSPAPAESPSRRRTLPEERITPRLIDILDFLDPCQHSEGMRQLVTPMNQMLNDARSLAQRLPDQLRYDKCDERFLPHLAANVGFELIDIAYATERERRRLVRDAWAIMKRRGTRWSIQRVIEDLGFSATFDETYQISGIWNRHKFWNVDAVTKSRLTFDWEDGSMQGFANEALGAFRANAGRLRGAALNAAASPTMSATVASSINDYQLSVDYRLLTAGDCFFGVVARYESASKAVIISLSKVGASETLTVYLYSGIWAPLATADIAGFDWDTGEHCLTIWDTGTAVTVILDQTTLMASVNYYAAVTAVKKGLFCAYGTQVDFDNFDLREIDRRKQPKWFAFGQGDKTLTITLAGTPYQATAKREYLEKIMVEFVPMDTTIVWN